ncbi:histidine kinase-like ATPase [Haematococcus lacustris]
MHEEGEGEAAGRIQPISKAVTHRICSGQVVLDLATAVKELVENAIDAGATIVEVRLKEYGSQLIEVSDNGSGVKAEDYQALTLKYHTSKLQTFADLAGLNTFGFRGEALSSLCALAHVSVVTCTQGQEAGVRLEYAHSGQLVCQEPCPRAVGTTVALKDLFSTLPVRHKEFLRNLKREYAKLVGLLQAYALVAHQVRFLVTNQAGKAGRQVLVSTQGGANNSMRANVVTVLGNKNRVLAGCVRVLPHCCLSLRRYVSKAAAGVKGDTSRQFFSINGRPVDLPKAAKVLNDTYRSLTSAANAGVKPVAILDIHMPPNTYDVNVTPDKRKVFMEAEAQLVAALEQVGLGAGLTFHSASR